MSTATMPPPFSPIAGTPTKRLMTTEELLALPESGMDRWLVNGELREKPMTVRNRFHSRTTISVGSALKVWLDQRPEPRGMVCGGEAGVRLRRNPDLTFGVDVVYIPPELVAMQSEKSTIIDGIPSLVVEILSPSDTNEEINEKIEAYLAAGVPHTWIIDPRLKLLTVHRPNELPAVFSNSQEITAEPQLPGFRISVARLFD